jgi:hypothetical protein
VTGGAQHHHTWDLGGLAQELYDGAFSYVYGLGRIAEVDGSGTTYYYLADPQGSVMALCDASGNVLNTCDYDVYGAVRSSSGSTATDSAAEDVTGSDRWRKDVPLPPD